MNQTTKPSRRYPDWLHYVLIIGTMVLFYYWLFGISMRPTEPDYEIPYSEFKTFVHLGEGSWWGGIGPEIETSTRRRAPLKSGKSVCL